MPVSVVDIRDLTREQDVVHTQQFSLFVSTQDYSTTLRQTATYMHAQYAHPFRTLNACLPPSMRLLDNL